ncbi:MAG: DUF6473 family protein, partial [Paracoccaceae bacterium]|nr:DUF6473 family protein [Paracoccaceae bacterium]
ASTVLQTYYYDVDFSEFTFTRHMLGALYDRSHNRFEAIVQELQQTWIVQMKKMIEQIGQPCMLLWFSADRLSKDHWSKHQRQLQVDPLFITASMIAELKDHVDHVVVANPSETAIGYGTKGMYFPKSQLKAASEMLGVACHKEGSSVLLPKIFGKLHS